MPDSSDNYQLPSWPPTPINRDLWNAVMGSIAARLTAREDLEATFESLQATGIQATLDYIQVTVAPQIATIQASIALAQEQIDQIVIDGIAPNAARLGGQLPSHYATASALVLKADQTYVDQEFLDFATATQFLLDQKADATATNNALEKRVRGDAAQNWTSAERAQARSNIRAAGQEAIDPVAKSGATPSLDLNFTGPGAEIGTFARASTGTYFDAAGVLRTAAVDTPRYDHDPATGECMGLLIESAATNFLLRSQELDTSAWTKFNTTVVANVAVAPDGTPTADKMVGSATTHPRYTAANNHSATNTVLTFSAYLKAAEHTFAWLQISNFASEAVLIPFDLVNGVVGVPSGATSDYSSAFGLIEDAGNGWFRCSLTATKGDFNETNICVIQSTAEVGDGTSGFYIWGAQLETGPYASSYIPTSGSPVTRAADIFTISTEGWLREGAGTAYVEGLVNRSNSIFPAFFELGGATFDNRFICYTWATSGVVEIGVVAALQPQAFGFLSDLGYGENIQCAMAYEADDFAFAGNGALYSTDNDGDVPAGLTVLRVGNDLGGNNLNGHIKRLIYWPQRLSNAKLAEITS